MWEFVLYQNAPRPGSWQAEGLTEGEQLAALGSSELFPFRLLITFAATTLVGIWSSCSAAACNTPYSARFFPRCIAHWARSARIPRKRGQLLGVQHYVPILPLLHRPQDALNCAMSPANLAGQDRPGKRSKYQIAQKQTVRFCVLFAFVVSGSYLSSRAVASQVLSAYKGLTSVFGMGTGGTPWLNHRNGYGVFSTHLENCIAFQFASIKPSTY